MSNRKDKNVPKPETNPGERLRYWRQSAKLTQAEVERRAGLAHNALSRIENGQVDPQFDTVVRIAEAMGMSFEEVQHRPLPSQQLPDGDGGLAELYAALERLPREKRRQLTRAFMQILEGLNE